MAAITMLCGKVGSGKSTYAKKLKSERNAVVLSCDEMMLALFDEYLGEDHARVYDKCARYLYGLAAELAQSGVEVVLDFGFWSRSQREEVKAAFTEKGILTRLCYVRAGVDTVARRLARRNDAIGSGETAYHIDEGMRALFDSRFEEPSPDEIDEIVESADPE